MNIYIYIYIITSYYITLYYVIIHLHRNIYIASTPVQAGMEPALRRRAYHCDVTYVTNVELGFDYLRDQLAQDLGELRLRHPEPFHCVIVDEADSVLIDEARTPLVISTQSAKPSEKYPVALQAAN